MMNEEQQKKFKAEFYSEVFKPMFFTAFTVAVFAALLDYSFQLIDAIETIAH